MCGIVGAFDLRGKRIFPRPLLSKMASTLQHRGPDEEGFHSTEGYAALVKRLILRDGPGGRQPMIDSGACLSLNGELFSFDADRRRLQAKGATFYTASDTEVFLKGLLREGHPFLAASDAQYALALYNAADHSLLLARDCFGVLPLYYAEAEGWLLYGSEAKAVLASGMLPARLNPNAVDHVMTMLALSPGESCFAGIHALGPGEALHVTAGPPAVRKSIQPRPAFTEPVSFHRKNREPIDALESHLLDSVARRLETETGPGLYLSGGVDSSLIASMAARILSGKKRADLTAYSIRLADGPADESAFAAVTAKQLGIRQKILAVSEQDIIEHFPAAVYAAEMPVLDHANIGLMLLARMVHKDGRKAVLTGEGADEAFGGYPWHRGNRLLRAAPGLLLDWFSSSLNREKNRLWRGFHQHPLFAALGFVRTLFYTKGFQEQVRAAEPPLFEVLASRAQSGQSSLSRSLALDYEWLMAGHLLLDKGDRVSMSASVEARYPFLDRSTVSFAAALADPWKIHRFQNKWILRKVAERYLTPAAAWRRKHLFRAEPAIHGPLRPRWVDQLLTPDALRSTGLFDPVLVARHLEARQSPSRWPKSSLIQVGLSGVVSTQLLYHLYCAPLCDLPRQS